MSLASAEYSLKGEMRRLNKNSHLNISFIDIQRFLTTQSGIRPILLLDVTGGEIEKHRQLALVHCNVVRRVRFRKNMLEEIQS
jgi:hypothetical protein